mgnify:CR=1 FL=1
MRRTLYLSMVCLLSAFSAVGQTGLRGLNPIEKQKLQTRLSRSAERSKRYFHGRGRSGEQQMHSKPPFYRYSPL